MFSNVIADVNQALITAQVYGILLYQGRRIQNPLTYKVIAEVLCVPQQWGVLSNALTAITEDDHKNGRPLLSSLVVSISTGLPGRGYWDLVARLGKWPGSQFVPHSTPDKAFWDDQFARVISTY